MTVAADDARFITGPPLVFNDKVLIGHGGADAGLVRGYVTAYDVHTGQQAWRFFVVLGDPAKGSEDKAMEMAAKTWTGEWRKFGGGGTVWNAMTYDPKYNRIYLGTGNGAPWNRKIRSPGGGDNLFLCSIVALDADTGEYLWHYQMTPGESWDYNSAADIQLATMTIDGSARDVILHAPKNGFFYVIDRSDGNLISAQPLTKVIWSERVDLQTGRPVETPEADIPGGEMLLFPGPQGGHGVQPMPYNPLTGLVYLSTSFLPGVYSMKGIDLQTREHPSHSMEATGLTSSEFVEELAPKNLSILVLTALQAWNPATQRAVWSIPSNAPTGGGVLSTAGNLVFRGRANGQLEAHDAKTGELLWSADAKNGIIGSPITYEIGNTQYISVLAGFGGSPTIYGEISAQFGWDYRTQRRRMLTFALDAKTALPPLAKNRRSQVVHDGTFSIDSLKSKLGKSLYERTCITCHGANAIAGGAAPDLRKSPTPLSEDAFSAVVRDGILLPVGMPRYDELSVDDVEGIQHYIRERANRALTNKDDPGRFRADQTVPTNTCGPLPCFELLIRRSILDANGGGKIYSPEAETVFEEAFTGSICFRFILGRNSCPPQMLKRNLVRSI